MAKRLVFVGTYSCCLPHVEGKGEGIYVYCLDPQSGALVPQRVFGEKPGDEPKEFLCCSMTGQNPSYLFLNATNTVLYAVNETVKDSTVSCFKVGPNGHLALINRQPCRGSFGCHLASEETGKFLLVANYMSGNIVVLPISKEDGSLLPVVEEKQHSGSGPNSQRQEAPHPHACVIDRHYVFVPDLGIDTVVQYELDVDSGVLRRNSKQSHLTMTPGSGPRHMVFHPTKRFAYINNELASTVTVCEYNSETGVLSALETLSTLPEDFQGDSWTAAIRVTPNGRFLYVSNRGHDSLAMFAINQSTGRLSSIGFQKVDQVPRDFNIDPEGKFLLVAHQNSHTIRTYLIQENDGNLIPTASVTTVPSPVSICFSINPLTN